MLVAANDPAAGWVQMVSNAHVWMVGNFPMACQEEVFAAGPDGPRARARWRRRDGPRESTAAGSSTAGGSSPAVSTTATG